MKTIIRLVASLITIIVISLIAHYDNEEIAVILGGSGFALVCFLFILEDSIIEWFHNIKTDEELGFSNEIQDYGPKEMPINNIQKEYNDNKVKTLEDKDYDLPYNTNESKEIPVSEEFNSYFPKFPKEGLKVIKISIEKGKDFHKYKMFKGLVGVTLGQFKNNCVIKFPTEDNNIVYKDVYQVGFVKVKESEKRIEIEISNEIIE